MLSEIIPLRDQFSGNKVAIDVFSIDLESIVFINVPSYSFGAIAAKMHSPSPEGLKISNQVFPARV
jgi:hypothetical protein